MINTDIEELIPHRAPMRWIDALTEYTDDLAVATTTFAADHLAVADGAVLETALIECAAQTAAAVQGWRAKVSGNPGVANGMLIAVTNFCIESRPPPGKVLRIEISERKRLGPMTMISSVIYCEGKAIATGNLTLYA